MGLTLLKYTIPWQKRPHLWYSPDNVCQNREDGWWWRVISTSLVTFLLNTYIEVKKLLQLKKNARPVAIPLTYVTIQRLHIPDLPNTFFEYLIDKSRAHSLYSISHHIKCWLIYIVMNVALSIDIFATTHDSDKSRKRWFYGRPVIAARGLGSRHDNVLLPT